MEWLYGLSIIFAVVSVFYLILRGINRGLIKYFHLNKVLAFLFTVTIISAILLSFLSDVELGCGSAAPTTNGTQRFKQEYRQHNLLPFSPHYNLPQLNSADNHAAELIKGKMASYIPDTMEVDKGYYATVNITQSLNDSILLKNLPDPKKYSLDTLEISPVIKVALIDPTGDDKSNLSGANFSIKPLNNEEQTVDPHSSRAWKWRIVPLTGNDKSELELRVTAIVLSKS